MAHRSFSRVKVDRLVLKTMPLGLPKAAITGGKAAGHWQRVEDNAFHLRASSDEFRRLLAAWFNNRDFGEIGREIVRGKVFNIHFDQAHKRTAKVWFACTTAINNHADC